MDLRALTLLNSRNNDHAWRATETEGQDVALLPLREESVLYRVPSLAQDIVLEFSWLQKQLTESLCQFRSH